MGAAGRRRLLADMLEAEGGRREDLAEKFERPLEIKCVGKLVMFPERVAFTCMVEAHTTGNHMSKRSEEDQALIYASLGILSCFQDKLKERRESFNSQLGQRVLHMTGTRRPAWECSEDLDLPLRCQKIRLTDPNSSKLGMHIHKPLSPRSHHVMGWEPSCFYGV